MNDIEIMKALFKAFSGGETICVELKDDSTQTGTIASFDGEKVTIAGREIPLADITAIGVPESRSENVTDDEAETHYSADSISELKLSRIAINYHSDKSEEKEEGILFDVCEDKLVLITDTEKKVILLKDVAEIMQPHDESKDHESSSDEHKVTAFEQAVIAGEKSVVDGYLTGVEALCAAGYAIEEANRILSISKTPVPWNDDDKNRTYNQARRIYTYVGNNGGIAEKLFNQCVSEPTLPYKLRIKAISALLDILAGETTTVELGSFVKDNYDVITGNVGLRLKAASLLIKGRDYITARSLVDESRTEIDFSETLFALSFYERNEKFDPSELKGVNAFDESVGFKEITNLLKLPDKNACIQLLTTYEKTGRVETFFALLDLFMPYARTEGRIVSLVGECLKKTGPSEYLERYLVEFPLLWFNKTLSDMYAASHIVSQTDNKKTKRLLNQCKRSNLYGVPNTFEDAVIKGNYQLCDVLRSNDGIMSSLGYSNDEIDRIRSVESDYFKYGTKTVIEKLLFLEGNKNFIPESTAAIDFLRAPESVSKALFPLLINEGFGEIVYELFNYTSYHREKLSTLKTLYLKALLLLNETEEYWDEVKNDWMTLGLDSQMLLVAGEIAASKGDQATSDAITAFVNKPDFNELENALISGDVSRLRSLSVDADTLISLGYSSDEIIQVQSSTRSKIDFVTKNSLSIANRIYAFQKNKNRTAELFYIMALKEDPQSAALGLLSIYSEEGRFKELCQCFETNLKGEVTSLTASNIDSYLMALYHTGQYEKMKNYWISESRGSAVDSLYVLKALLEASSSDDDIRRLLDSALIVNKDNSVVAVDCVLKLCGRTVCDVTADAITALYNQLFCFVDADTIRQICQIIPRDVAKFSVRPDGSGIMAIFETDNSQLLHEWCDMLFTRVNQADAWIAIIRNIAALYNTVDGVKGIIKDKLIALTKTGTVLPDELEIYLYPQLSDDNEKIAWLENILDGPTDIDELTFNLFVKYSKELDDIDRLYVLLVKLAQKQTDYNDIYLKTVISALSVCVEERRDQDLVRNLLDCFLRHCNQVSMNTEDFVILCRAYIYVGQDNYAYLTRYILNLKGIEISENIIEGRSFTSIVTDTLGMDGVDEIDKLCSVFGKYIHTTEDDASNLGQLRDYYNMPEKWTQEAIESLMKYFIGNASSSLYWQLLSVYYANSTCVVKGNIQFHQAIINNTSFIPVLSYFVNNNLKSQTIGVLRFVFATANPKVFEELRDTVSILIKKNQAWFADPRDAKDIIAATVTNQRLKANPIVWSEVLSIIIDLVFIAGVEEDFWKNVIQGPDKLDPSIIEKFVCGLLLNKNNNYPLINSAQKAVEINATERPYSKLLSDILLQTKGNRQLSPVQTEQIKIVNCSTGSFIDETAIYQYYVDAGVEGNKCIAEDALRSVHEYLPELDVFDDIKKYSALSENVTDEDLVRIYTDEYKGLIQLVNPRRRQKVIMNLIPGEMCLKAKGYDVPSAYSYGVSVLSQEELLKVREEKELYDSLDNIFPREKYPGLVVVFLGCCFTRRWTEFLDYSPEDSDINQIVMKDSSIKAIFMRKSHDIIKSAVLSVIDGDPESVSIGRRAFYTAFSTPGFNRGTDFRLIQRLPDEDKAILRKVFSLRIESKTLRDTGIIGATILRIPGSERIANFLSLYKSNILSLLFNNKKSFNALLEFERDKATEIAAAFSILFPQGSDNIFNRFLTQQLTTEVVSVDLEESFEKALDVCKEKRERYLKIKDAVENGDISTTNNEFKAFTIAKIEYLFEAIINGSENDLLLAEPLPMDYCSVITYLFNKNMMSELRDYLWKIKTEALLPSLSVVLTLLEQYPEAYKVATQLKDEQWRIPALQILMRTMKFSKAFPEDKVLTVSLKEMLHGDYGKILFKLFPKFENQKQPYVDRMHSLRKLYDDFLRYLSLNGLDVSTVSFNGDRFEASIKRYSTQSAVIIEAKSEVPKVITEQSGLIRNLISDNSLYQKLAAMDNVNAAEYIGKGTPQIGECISGLMYLYEAKGSSSRKEDVLNARMLLRWMYLLFMNDEGYAREYLNKTLELITAEDEITFAQWTALVSYLSQYFEDISSVQQLSRVVENDITYLQNITEITASSHIKFLRPLDKKSWSNIIEVLVNIAGIDFARTVESEQISRLAACRSKLLANSESIKSSLFGDINDRLLRLIEEQIISLRNTPELLINIVGEMPDNSQRIVWEYGNDTGTLYAIISNMGGADCNQVKLLSRINMIKEHKYFISKIYAGEKIPFKDSFTADDLTDGKATWDIELSYYDNDKNQTITLTHESIINVETGDEPFNLGNISTGNPARGKNFVGRARELAILRNHYSDIEQLPSMLIRGLKRSGKSSILIKFTDEMRKKNAFLVAFVDGQSIGSGLKTAFIDKVFDSLRIGYRGNKKYEDIFNDKFEEFKQEWDKKLESADWIGRLDAFYYDLSQLFGKKILIVIDEMESIFYNHRFESIQQEESLYAALRSLIQRPENYVSFIFCGSDTLLTSCLEQRRESQMFQTLQYLEVGHMNIGDIKEIYRKQSEKYDIDFTPDAVDTIWQFTHGLVWYAKLLGYLVINNIMSHDLTIRKEVNRADIMTAIQMLINGEIGTDKYDLVDASLNTPRTAIVHAMASIMPDYNKTVSVDEVFVALEDMRKAGYINPRNGESIPPMDEVTVKEHLDFLEKMQFVDSNAAKTKYLFTAELYRLFFRKDKKLHMFEERSEKRQ